VSAKRVIFHIDMDAFFASIEQRDNPPYRGKPVVVGALPGTRGVVSAASYEARRFGIRSAMPIHEAYARCPHGVFVRPNMAVYARESDALMHILADFSPAVEQISVDEAFLDITGTERLWGDPLRTAQAISAAIREQRNLTASIGIAPNKFLAKVASDFDKPDGITQVPFESDAIMEWLAPLPVRTIWGVGRTTEQALARLGISTVGELQGLSRELLFERFGKMGGALYGLCRGIDAREVVFDAEEAKSISREHTFGEDTPDREAWEQMLLALSQDVARRARRAGVKGRTVVLIYRLSDFNKHTRRRSFREPVDTAKRIYDEALVLLPHIPSGARVRLIGVGLTAFGEPVQTDLFAGEVTDRWSVSERAIDKLEVRFGRGAVKRGRQVGSHDADRARGGGQ